MRVDKALKVKQAPRVQENKRSRTTKLGQFLTDSDDEAEEVLLKDAVDDIPLVEYWTDFTTPVSSYYLEVESDKEAVKAKKQEKKKPSGGGIKPSGGGIRFARPSSLSCKWLIFNHTVVGILFSAAIQMNPQMLFEMFISNSKLEILPRFNSVVLIIILMHLNYLKTTQVFGNRITSFLSMYLLGHFCLMWCRQNPKTSTEEVQDSWIVRSTCFTAYALVVLITILLTRTNATRRKIVYFLWRNTREAGCSIFYVGYVRAAASPLCPPKINQLCYFLGV